MKFSEWLIKREMCGTGAIYDPKERNNPDFQWWGAPESTIKPRKKKKKHVKR